MCRGWGKDHCVVFRRNWEEVWRISPGAVLVFSVSLFFPPFISSQWCLFARSQMYFNIAVFPFLQYL